MLHTIYLLQLIQAKINVHVALREQIYQKTGSERVNIHKLCEKKIFFRNSEMLDKNLFLRKWHVTEDCPEELFRIRE